MKEYLKMSDFVVGNVSMSMNHNGDVSVQYDYADPDMVVRKTMDAMEHAVNSHDELVAEVERLRRQLAYAFMAGWEEGVNGMECDEAEVASVEIAEQFAGD